MDEKDGHDEEQARQDARHLQKHVVPCFDDYVVDSVAETSRIKHPGRIIKDPELVIEPETPLARYLALFFALVVSVLLVLAVTHYGGRPVSQGVGDESRVAEPPTPGVEKPPSERLSRNEIWKMDKEFKVDNRISESSRFLLNASKYSYTVFQLTPVETGIRNLKARIYYPPCFGVEPHDLYYPKSRKVYSEFVLLKPASLDYNKCLKQMSEGGVIPDKGKIPILITSKYDPGNQSSLSLYYLVYRFEHKEDGKKSDPVYMDIEFIRELDKNENKKSALNKTWMSEGAIKNRNPFTLDRVAACKGEDSGNRELRFAFEVRYKPGDKHPAISLVGATSQFEPSTIQMTMRMLMEDFDRSVFSGDEGGEYHAYIVCRCGSNPGCELKEE